VVGRRSVPYKQVWFDPPSDSSIPVLAELPEGVREFMPGMVDPPEASGNRQRYYKCRYCKGWIPGIPRDYQVNTLAPLSGRKGVETYCIRCGKEISFCGMMS
jgi:hypothetical protein